MPTLPAVSARLSTESLPMSLCFVELVVALPMDTGVMRPDDGAEPAAEPEADEVGVRLPVGVATMLLIFIAFEFEDDANDADDDDDDDDADADDDDNEVEDDEGVG